MSHGSEDRSKRSRGGAMASLFWKVCGFAVNMNGRAAFSEFSALRPVFKKVCFQALRFQDPCGQSAKMVQYMCV